MQPPPPQPKPDLSTTQTEKHQAEEDEADEDKDKGEHGDEDKDEDEDDPFAALDAETLADLLALSSATLDGLVAWWELGWCGLRRGEERR